MHSSANHPRNILAGGLILLLVVALCDLALKHWAVSLSQPIDLGFVRFFAYKNEGILGGYLSDMHPWVIRIFFSVLFGFLCVAGGLIIHLLEHKPVARLKWGIMIYLSGVLGNIYERMLFGQITDFVVVHVPIAGEMAFNFADLIVMIGFALITFSIFKDSKLIWFEGSQRRGHWIEPKFQKSFGLLFVLVGLAHFAVIAMYSFTYLKAFITPDLTIEPLDVDKVIFDYLMGLFLLEGFALFLTFAISVFFSHRMIGPLIALENYFKKNTESQSAHGGELKLRRSDYFGNILRSIAKNARPKEGLESKSLRERDSD